MSDDSAPDALNTAGTADLAEADAEAALLALGGVLEWKCREEDFGRRWDAESSEPWAMYQINIGAKGTWLGMMGSKGKCSFPCASVDAAKAACDMYALTGDWAALRRLEAATRHAHDFDPDTALLSSGTVTWTDYEHHMCFINVRGEYGEKRYKVTVSTFHAEDRWCASLKEPVEASCSEGFETLVGAKAACERHLVTGRWTEEP